MTGKELDLKCRSINESNQMLDRVLLDIGAQSQYFKQADFSDNPVGTLVNFDFFFNFKSGTS